MADQARFDGPAGAPPGSSGRPVQDFAPPIARAEPTRITPRSARARLEPEHLPQPSRASKRARHPIVVIGNAIFTTIILLAIAGGISLAVGKQRFEAPGPLAAEKVVNIPPRSGVTDIADILVR